MFYFNFSVFIPFSFLPRLFAHKHFITFSIRHPTKCSPILKLKFSSKFKLSKHYQPKKNISVFSHRYNTTLQRSYGPLKPQKYKPDRHSMYRISINKSKIYFQVDTTEVTVGIDELQFFHLLGIHKSKKPS